MFPFSIWRIELAHPALVHFPIAFLLGATCCILASLLFRSKKRRALLERLVSFQLAVATLGIWLAIWSGEKAHSIVNRVICDPGVTQAHEDWSWWIAYGLSTAFLLFSVSGKLRRPYRNRARLLARFTVLCLAPMLVYSAHLGASLVYLQGAAVHLPDAECSVFSD